ncbi:RING-H2 finger protein ATL16-like [Andrographis paniculata]|uniref:RING-H2 finger protein ATL16-like n=1 Tax=Andrographis paniculata TaxID=175694 RepID=UPI0021E740DE|nr:RING-H2 finger protein ATL16-like [Andrographis paniculata]
MAVPITAVAIIGILATALLLLTYYVFVINCCLNCHRIDLLRRLSSRHRHHHHHRRPPSPTQTRGLTDAAIRSIPIFIFNKTPSPPASAAATARRPCDCAVCLNEFHGGDKLRILPNCAHIFHIDCIDVWLQNSPDCPLCRTAAVSPEIKIPGDAPPQDLNPQFDEDYVAIEIPAAAAAAAEADPISGEHFPSRRKKSQIGSMGDEWIEDHRKMQQPMRRSFSMDSAGDAQLGLAVEEIIERRRRRNAEYSGSPSSGKKSFFSFGQKCSLRNSVQVQPLTSEP